MKNFAIIINFEEKKTYLGQNKNENPREFSFVKQCVNLLLSAVDRKEIIGVAVGEWSNIVFLQCGTQVGLSIEHLARQGDKRDNAVITVLLQGSFSDFEYLAHLLGGVVAFAIHLRLVVCAHCTNVVTQCAQLIKHCSAICLLY